MQFLENETLRVSISEAGAELTSILKKDDGTEYVWNADPKFWNRHAPILFPVVGRLKEQTYTLNGQTFPMTKHGFARDLTFSAQKISDTCAEFTLHATPETRKLYPYEFTLTVRYTLNGNALTKEHIVRNDSPETLYYEVGGHDAYRILFGSEALSDYYVEFPGTDVLDVITVDENVLLSQEHHQIPLQNGRLYLTRETFTADALMLDRLPVRRCTIGCTKHDRKVTMDFTDFDFFAVWSPYKPEQDVPFVCMEPWSTLPDGAYLGQAIEEKVGIRTVKPGESENLKFTVSIA